MDKNQLAEDLNKRDSGPIKAALAEMRIQEEARTLRKLEIQLAVKVLGTMTAEDAKTFAWYASPETIDKLRKVLQ